MSDTLTGAVPERTTRSRTAAERARRRTIRETVGGWGMLAPAVIILGIMVGYPAILMVIHSFTDYTVKNKVQGTTPNFVWFDNYVELFSYSDFPAVLGRSLALMVVLTALIMILGMLVAAFMHRISRGWRLLVSIGLLLAWAMPPLTATVVWGWIFDPEYGLVNWVLYNITDDTRWVNHSWLFNPWSFFMVLTIIIVWQGIPFAAFAFYAGLGQVPGEVLEAASLDGANVWKRFWQITFPYMRNIVTGVLVLEVIWNLRIFTQVYALQERGGITSQTNVLPVYLFRQGVGEIGMTAAIGMVMVVILVILSIGNVRQTLKHEEL